MNDLKFGTDYVKALLAQEPMLETTDFGGHRARILARLVQAELRERYARWAITVLIGLVLIGFSLIFAADLEIIGSFDTLPEWIKESLSTAFFLVPVALLLVLPIYLLRRRELNKASRQADQLALAALQMQIEDLKRRLSPGTAATPASSTVPDAPPTSSSGDDSFRHSRGFTLLEMLVVLAVLGVLAGMLFPALARAKARARITMCQNNLGQLGRALAMYVADSHRYPGTCGSQMEPSNTVGVNQPPPPAAAADDAAFWDRRLLPYLADNIAVLRCPDHVATGRETVLYHGFYRANFHYGYNAFGSGVNGPELNLGLGRIWVAGGKLGTIFTTPPLVVMEGNVLAPADMIALIDRRGGVLMPCTFVMPGDPANPTDNDPGHHHKGGANAVFCDVHVEYAPQARWQEQSESARRRWNNDHQPHPETW